MRRGPPRSPVPAAPGRGSGRSLCLTRACRPRWRRRRVHVPSRLSTLDDLRVHSRQAPIRQAAPGRRTGPDRLVGRMQSLAMIENWPVPTAAAAVVRADGTVAGYPRPAGRTASRWPR